MVQPQEVHSKLHLNSSLNSPLIQLEIDEEYEEIMSDVKDECGKYGTVTGLKAPRPKVGVVVPAVGKIFVEFSTIDEAKEARKVSF